MGLVGTGWGWTVDTVLLRALSLKDTTSPPSWWPGEMRRGSCLGRRVHSGGWRWLGGRAEARASSDVFCRAIMRGSQYCLCRCPFLLARLSEDRAGRQELPHQAAAVAVERGASSLQFPPLRVSAGSVQARKRNR